MATPHIAIQEITYTGGVVRDDQGKLVLDHTGASTVYVGEPTAELDERWDRLESGSGPCLALVLLFFSFATETDDNRAAIELILQDSEATTKDGRKLDTMHSDGEYRTRYVRPRPRHVNGPTIPPSSPTIQCAYR